MFIMYVATLYYLVTICILKQNIDKYFYSPGRVKLVVSAQVLLAPVMFTVWNPARNSDLE